MYTTDLELSTWSIVYEILFLYFTHTICLFNFCLFLYCRNWVVSSEIKLKDNKKGVEENGVYITVYVKTIEHY